MWRAFGLLDRQLLLVGVDDEDQVGNAAHVLDAAERLFELVAFARQHQALFLGQAGGAGAELVFELAQARIEPEMVFQLVSMPPSQR